MEIIITDCIASFGLEISFLFVDDCIIILYITFVFKLNITSIVFPYLFGHVKCSNYTDTWNLEEKKFIQFNNIWFWNTSLFKLYSLQLKIKNALSFPTLHINKGNNVKWWGAPSMAGSDRIFFQQNNNIVMEGNFFNVN